MPAASRRRAPSGRRSWRRRVRRALLALSLGGVVVDVVLACRTGAAAPAWRTGVAVLAGLAVVAVAAAVSRRRRSIGKSPARHALAAPLNLLAAGAVLAVGVLAWFTGRLGWAGLVAAIAAIIVPLIARPYLGRLALIAGVFAVSLVLVTNLFSSGDHASALPIAIATLIVPLTLGEQVLTRMKLADATRAQRVMMLVLVLVFAGLGWVRSGWMPGVLHQCFTPPSSHGSTVLRASGDGSRCYGLIDTADPGVFARHTFGQNETTRNLELALLGNNRPVRPGDLTVIWMGTLSCKLNPADAAGCVDGIDYPNERDQLRALLVAQLEAEAGSQPHVHVVIADILPDVVYADAVAELIVDHREAFGKRLVVMGGTDSRDQTERAINRLLNAGIPFIAPSLLGDLDRPAKPFVDRPGYFQLSPPSRLYARDLVSRLRKLYPQGADLLVYQLPNASDQYTTSLLNDVTAEVHLAAGISGPPAGKGKARKASGRRLTARHLTGPGQLDRSICKQTRKSPPTVLFFADRWTKFTDFINRVDMLCPGAGPHHVFADGSVSRFMANYHLRSTSTVAWPLDYYVPGPGCPSRGRVNDLVTRIKGLPGKVGPLFGMGRPDAFTCRESDDSRMCTLDVAAVRQASTPCEVNELGTSLAPAWDAVMLAEAVVVGGDLATTSTDGTVELPGGTRVSVVGGRLQNATVDIDMWHADAISDPAHTWLLTK